MFYILALVVYHDDWLCLDGPSGYMTNWLCPWFMRYFLYSMDKFIKGKKITAQGVSEPPGPIGVSSSVPGSTRRSSSD